MRRLADWLDIRPGETRPVAVATLRAFSLLAFAILGRSLREALFLTTFPVEYLPYITAGVVILGLPVVGAFTRLLEGGRPRTVLAATTLVVAAGLLLLWPLLGHSRVAVILFFLWTALGTILLTSGFWVMTAESFAVRGAKRLFGLIGAGGTAGALVMGVTLSRVADRVSVTSLVGLLAVLLGLVYLLATLFPSRRTGAAKGRRFDRPPRTSLPERLRLIWGDRYLRNLAAIVFLATAASTLVDFQFKELARARVSSPEDLTGFLGGFYGWTGGAALLIQLALASRIMARAGIGPGLAILPVCLILGSAGLFLAPGLLVVTLLRGADNSLRKSLFRPLLEFLYVPLPVVLRRRTKTFVDSSVDSLAEGVGAAIIFLWVTLPGLPSRYLSLFVIVLAILLILLARRMGRLYLEHIVHRLKDAGPGHPGGPERSPVPDLLSGVYTRLDLEGLTTGFALKIPDAEPAVGAPDRTGDPAETLTLLRSRDDRLVRKGLAGVREWDDRHLEALVPLLARDSLYRKVVEILGGLGDRPVASLARFLRDREAAFVIRRRIPVVLATVGSPAADDALLGALVANRFEVRYRAAVALVRRRRNGLPVSLGPWQDQVWDAIGFEVGRERPVWELQKILDGFDAPDDELVARHVETRGALSLEHTFRMLTLVLDPQPVLAAYHGLLLKEEELKGFALEFLEQALPADIRRRLWLFIGDASQHRQRKELRSIDQVASDLMATRATLFRGQTERNALERLLGQDEE